MSGHDDLLTRATRRLREETDAPARDPERTRARILLRASSGRRRSKRLLWIAPMAAALAASTAWAATHATLPKAWHEVRSLFVVDKGTDRETAATHAGAAGIVTRIPKPRSTGDDASVVAEVALDSLPVATVPLDSLPRVPKPSTTASAPIPVAPPTASSTPADGTEATRLYAVAHEAHFVTRDPDAALAAWDAYLRVAPDGPLAPEARYNRALTLIRLGRKNEARLALTPFARGEVDGYREREARKLIEALAEP